MEPVLKLEGFSGILIVSENPERLARFYRDVLGIPLEGEQHDDTLPHWGCTLGDVHFAIHPVEDFPDPKSGVGAVKLAFTVLDVRAFSEEVQKRGVTLLYPPRDEEFFVSAALLDPDGNFVELTEHSDAWFEGMEERRGRGESVLERWRVAKGTPPLSSAGPAKPVERRVIEGLRISLCPLAPDVDVDDLYTRSHGDPRIEELWRYMGYGPFQNKQAMLDWLRSCEFSTDPLFLTVADKATGERLGMVSFLAIRPPMRVLELGHIWYVPEAQGTGVNTEAVYLMLTEAFERLGYRRVEWKCDSLNARSRRAAIRLGFTFEGIFRQHMIVKGKNRDTAWFALLARDWPRVKERLEASL